MTATEKYREDLRTAQQNKLICLKAGTATRLDRFFLGINAQFIAQRKLQLKTLALLEFNDPNIAELITNAMTLMLQKYKADMSDILSLATDNDANMVCCIKLIDNKMLNSVIKSDVQADDDHEPSTQHEDSDPEEDETKDAVNIFVSRMRSADHTLQLRTQYVLKGSKCMDMGTGRAAPHCP